MVKDIPILIVKYEKDDCLIKQYTHKVTTGEGKVHLPSFYRKVKSFLLNDRRNKNVTLEFSDSLIYSSADISNVNDTLNKISQLYNESNYFADLNGNMPIDVFLNFTFDRSERALLRIYNYSSYENDTFDHIKNELSNKNIKYSSGEVFYFDNVEEAGDMLFYIKMKYPNCSFEHKIYSIKNNILSVE